MWGRDMKVRDLLLQLQGLDRSMELVCFCDDEGARQRRSPFLVYDVQRVDIALITRSSRGGSPPAVFGFGRQAKRVAVVTTDL